MADDESGEAAPEFVADFSDESEVDDIEDGTSALFPLSRSLISL